MREAEQDFYQRLGDWLSHLEQERQRVFLVLSISPAIRNPCPVMLLHNEEQL
jgi:hypothetical protein